MSGEPTTTIVGNLVRDVELRFLPSGVAVATISIASTPRIFDKQSNTSKDGETWFVRATAWREMAEHCAETLVQGSRVIAFGRLVARSWEKDGQTRSTVELELEAIGPDLRFATAKITKTQRGSGGGNSSSGVPAQSQPADDPWATSGAGFSGGQSEPPF